TRALDEQVRADSVDDAVLAADGHDLPGAVDGLGHTVSSFLTPAVFPRAASTRLRAARLRGKAFGVFNVPSPARAGSGRRALVCVNVLRGTATPGRHHEHAETPGPHRRFRPSVQQTQERGTSGTLTPRPDAKFGIP